MLHKVLEIATSENLSDDGYLEANPDVKHAGMSARDHFRNYGEAEGRQQISREYLSNLEAYRADKFRKFRGILQLHETDRAKLTFPIVIGKHHFSLDEYAQESANSGFGPFNAEIESNPDGLYMDLGCGFRDSVYTNCLYLEVYPSRTADIIVEPTCLYPIASSSLDGIGCFAVLEHTRKPWLVVQEIQRMLKRGGKAFIDWPFLPPVHGYPSHFFNATREGLRSIFEDNGFEIEVATTGPHETPAYTINWLLREMLMRLPEGDAKERLRNVPVGQLAELLPRSDFWLGIMGQLPESAIVEFACGNWIAAVKKITLTGTSDGGRLLDSSTGTPVLLRGVGSQPMSNISADAVRMAYRLFLDREPESDAVVTEKVASIANYQDLRNGFLSSPEFQKLYPSINTAIQNNYWATPAPIEVDVPPATLNQLLARLRNQWRELGEKEPYWSVLTHEDYLAKNLDVDKISQFYETGSDSARLIELFEQRTGTRANRGTCLELGCGVGRVTLHLAKRFKRVIAGDISPGNLALCKRQMEQTGTFNVETVLLDSPVALANLGKFDFFFSIIVLQHNPPPIQKLFLESALRQIEAGGACLFQTLGSLPHYTFSAEQFLKSNQQVMDMHCLPKPVVMKLIHDCGLTVRDVELDPWVGCFGSYTYFATRDR